jgi:hypothetical protein
MKYKMGKEGYKIAVLFWLFLIAVEVAALLFYHP